MMTVVFGAELAVAVTGVVVPLSHRPRGHACGRVVPFCTAVVFHDSQPAVDGWGSRCDHRISKRVPPVISYCTKVAPEEAAASSTWEKPDTVVPLAGMMTVVLGARAPCNLEPAER